MAERVWPDELDVRFEQDMHADPNQVLGDEIRYVPGLTHYYVNGAPVTEEDGRAAMAELRRRSS